MIKIQCEVSDVQAFLSKHAEMQTEMDRQWASARQAWDERDNLLETITQLRAELARMRDNVTTACKAQLDQLPSGTHTSWQTVQFVQDLILAVLDHRKIAAIKAVRSLCGPPSGGPMGLKEAKDLVETFEPFKAVNLGGDQF